MKVSSSPLDWQTRDTANKLVYRIDQKAEYLLERHRPKDGVIEDRYYSTGCGRGFYTETRDGNFRLELDPATGKPTSYLDRYAHTEGSFRDEVLSMKAAPDGGKTYQRKLYHDGGGQILSQTETVKVSPEGTVDYELKPDSKVNLTNWIRRNRSVETLAALSVGGTLGALAGNAIFGGYGAVMGGLLGANLGNAVVSDDQKINHRSDPSNLERAIWRPVDQLRTGVQVGGAITGVGLIFALAAAISL